MAKPKRRITLCLIVVDESHAAQIWKAAGDGSLFAGCQIKTIANGDLLDRIQTAEDTILEAISDVESRIE